MLRPLVGGSTDVIARLGEDVRNAGANVDAFILIFAGARTVIARVVAENDMPAFSGFLRWRATDRFERGSVGDAGESFARFRTVEVEDEPSGRAGDESDIRVGKLVPLQRGDLGVEDRIARAFFVDGMLTRVRAFGIAA